MQAAFKNSYYQRYALLRQLYSELAYLQGLGTFYRPLFMEFPEEPSCHHKNISETQAMLGDSLMTAPILNVSLKSRAVYLPDSFY